PKPNVRWVCAWPRTATQGQRKTSSLLGKSGLQSLGTSALTFLQHLCKKRRLRKRCSSSNAATSATVSCKTIIAASLAPKARPRIGRTSPNRHAASQAAKKFQRSTEKNKPIKGSAQKPGNVSPTASQAS